MEKFCFCFKVKILDLQGLKKKELFFKSFLYYSYKGRNRVEWKGALKKCER